MLPDEADALMERRFAIINIWRSIAGTVETSPLAFCDSTTLGDGDLVEVTRQARDRIGQIQMARFNPAHEWFYFPAMQQNEAALIKTYDSALDGRTRFTIHTAFTDPTSPPDAAPRQSIETRCFAFFQGRCRWPFRFLWGLKALPCGAIYQMSRRGAGP